MKPVPLDLNKLSDVVEKEAVKKDVYNEFVKNVDAIQATDTDLVKKADYGSKIDEIEKEILDHNHDKYITTK